jgi:hypothetical protein
MVWLPGICKFQLRSDRDMSMFKDDLQSGQPSNAWNPERVVKVHELVARDHQMTLKLMEDQKHINREMLIRQILHEDLAKTKIYAKSVPYSVKDEQKERSHNLCRLNLQPEDQSTLYQLHQYTRWVLGVLVWSWNKLSQQQTENANTHVLLEKVKDQNKLQHLFGKLDATCK